MGAEAALAVLEAKPETAPCVICLDGNKITKRPLMECVEKVCMSMFIWLLTILLRLSNHQKLRFHRCVLMATNTAMELSTALSR